MRKRIKDYSISPDEIFLDDSNLSAMDTHQFEGRIEKPIGKLTIYLAGAFILCLGLVFLGRTAYLQVVEGKSYAERSKNNSLRHTVILPPRGIIYDRTGTELAWNRPARAYIEQEGFSSLLGYLGYPEDATNTAVYAEKELIGKAGLENRFNAALTGEKGVRVEEVDVKGDIVSNYSLKQAESGATINLAIDARVQEKFYSLIKQVALDRGFAGGAGAIMDVRTGELIALVSYPEYSSNIMTTRSDPDAIKRYLTDEKKPFLNRAVGGLYAPGSIIKPVIAIAALNEKIIDPNKNILSTGKLEIPNPYNPKEKTVFKDWKAHGYVDMRKAIAQSSDEYFYQIGGGYQSQAGLGIANIDKYLTKFGLAQPSGVEIYGDATGTIPTPEWKAKTFDGEPWRLGDTYHTAIGQYGMLVTPIQMVKMAGALANKGKLLEPTILKHEGSTTPISSVRIDIPARYFEVIEEGMRMAVADAGGTAHGLDIGAVKIAAKTGTAELGVSKNKVNSWAIGFWPYEQPKYAFVVAMERGARENTIGGVFVMRSLFDWLAVYLPEYLE